MPRPSLEELRRQVLQAASRLIRHDHVHPPARDLKVTIRDGTGIDVVLRGPYDPGSDLAAVDGDLDDLDPDDEDEDEDEAIGHLSASDKAAIARCSHRVEAILRAARSPMTRAEIVTALDGADKHFTPRHVSRVLKLLRGLGRAGRNRAGKWSFMPEKPA